MVAMHFVMSIHVIRETDRVFSFLLFSCHCNVGYRALLNLILPVIVLIYENIIPLTDRQTDRQTEKQVAFIGRDYSRKYLKMRLMLGEAEGV